MTGTSKALKRLGVAGLSVAMFTGGMTALGAPAALAAAGPTTTVTLTPPSDTAAVGTCNTFTATIDTLSTVTVQISQSLPQDNTVTPGSAHNIGFCVPDSGANDSTPTTTATPTPPAANTDVNASDQCYNKTGTDATVKNTVTCYAEFTDTADTDTTVVFGVRSTDPGTMSVVAFGDTDGSGTADVGEPSDSSTKTWVANDSTAAGTQIDCGPETADNDTGDTHDFTCTVTDANGVELSGADVEFMITDGPDKNATTTNFAAPQFAQCSETGDNNASGVGGDEGVAECSFTNNGTPGTDTIYAYVEQNGASGAQQTEPSDTISKTFTEPPPPAPATSDIQVTCSPHPTNTDGDICQDDPVVDDSATFTATVTNGVPAAPVSGVRVVWDFTPAQDSLGDDDPNEDTEALSSDRCITGADGTCSVTFTDSEPLDGESFDVTGTIDRGVGGPDDDTATKNFIKPDDSEARNVAVQPGTANQDAGGAQEFMATVTDRFGNPVEGADVDWSETGPGDFRNDDFCTTDDEGQCSVEVASLPAERGAETVTADITGNSIGTDDEAECNSPAGFSNFNENGTYVNAGSTPNPNGQNNVAPGAPAGNCTASGTVTWSEHVTPPPTKKRIIATIHCFSPKKHVLKCRVHETPEQSGLKVRFKRRIHGDVRWIGVDFTNNNGVAKLTKRHLKSGKLWRVFAHVYATSTTKGTNTDLDRTHIK